MKFCQFVFCILLISGIPKINYLSHIKIVNLYFPKQLFSRRKITQVIFSVYKMKIKISETEEITTKIPSTLRLLLLMIKYTYFHCI